MALTIDFLVKPEGYACLTIEAVSVSSTGSDNPPNPPPVPGNDTVAGILPPPTLQAIINVPKPDAPAAAAPQPSSVGRIAASNASQEVQSGYVGTTSRLINIITRPWNVWFDSVWRNIQLLMSLVNPTGTPGGTGTTTGPLVLVNAWSVDETDVEWFGFGTIGADPATKTFTPVIHSKSRFGQAIGAVTVTNGGGDYTTANQSDPIVVTFSGGGGSGAQGYAKVTGGSIVEIVMTEHGWGYTTPPTIDISGGGGTGATAECLLFSVAPGQYFVWNDPGADAGYEIFKLVSIDYVTGELTIERAPVGAADGEAQFKSVLAAHTNKNFYLLVPGGWVRMFDGSVAAPQRWILPWPNMCVCAVTLQVFGGGMTIQNTASFGAVVVVDVDKPCPGLRTLSGAAYLSVGLNGELAADLTAQNRAAAGQSWETIRTVYGKLRTPAVGATSFHDINDATVIYYLCWINKERSAVGLVDTVIFGAGKYTSYDMDYPQLRRMPYHKYWPFSTNAPFANLDWPPSRFPSCVDAASPGAPPLDADGNLIPMNIDASVTVPFEPDGDFDFIIVQVGTGTAGSDVLSVEQL